MIGVVFALITGCFSHWSSMENDVGAVSEQNGVSKIPLCFKTYRKGGEKEEKQKEKGKCQQATLVT